MSEWQETTLGSIADVTMGQSPCSDQMNNSEIGMPFLQGNRTFGLLYPVFDTWTTSPTKIAKANDVIMSVRAPVGDVNITPTTMCLGRGVCSLRLHNGNQRFLYYLMRHYSPELIRQENGTVFGSVNRTDINSLRVVVPGDDSQRRIAAVLSALDDKIELNNRINANLEAQAQALFRSWFVDFEPWGGEMPETWREGTLNELLELRRDTIQPGDKPSLPYLPIDVIPMRSFALTELRPNSEAQSSLQEFQPADIIIGAMRVYFHRVVPAPIAGITRSTCFVLRSRKPEYWAYSLLQCNQDATIDFAQQTSKGSTMPYAVWDGGMGDYPVCIPNQSDARRFNEVVSPLVRKIQSVFFQNRTLAALRDALLPKLMSGEIDVEKVEIPA